MGRRGHSLADYAAAHPWKDSEPIRQRSEADQKREAVEQTKASILRHLEAGSPERIIILTAAELISETTQDPAFYEQVKRVLERGAQQTFL